MGAVRLSLVVCGENENRMVGLENQSRDLVFTDWITELPTADRPDGGG